MPPKTSDWEISVDLLRESGKETIEKGGRKEGKWKEEGGKSSKKVFFFFFFFFFCFSLFKTANIVQKNISHRVKNQEN